MFDWIVYLLDRFGELGVFLLMLIENIIPPIPSEIVMPLAGYVASREQASLVLMTLAGTAGSLLGTSGWYFLGVKFGRERLISFASRHGRWLTMTPEDINRAIAWFSRYGSWALVIGRMVPGVRTFISVPAGIAEIPLIKFICYSAVGTLMWTALLATAGYWLGQGYKAVGDYVEPISNGVLLLLVVIYLYRVVTFRSAHDRREKPDPGT